MSRDLYKYVDEWDEDGVMSRKRREALHELLNKVHAEALSQPPAEEPEPDPDRVKMEGGRLWLQLSHGDDGNYWVPVDDCVMAQLEAFRDECDAKGREDGLREALDMVEVLRGASFKFPGDAVLQAIEGIQSLQTKG